MDKNLKLNVLEQIKNVFINASTTTMDDLSRKQTNEIASIIFNNIDCRDDGDSDGCYIFNYDYGFVINHHGEDTIDFTNHIDRICIYDPVTDNYVELTMDIVSSEIEKTKEYKINFVNLTPHTCVVYGTNKTDILMSVESTGVARVKTNEPVVDTIVNIPVMKTEYLNVENLPNPVDDTVYIVSILVLQALKGKRNDVVAPNTSPSACVRDTSGNILGTTGFTKI